MNIESAKYITTSEGYPQLHLQIDGKQAIISDFKKSILDLGYVRIGSSDPNVSWEKILPEHTLPETEDSRELTLRGFTNDPRILQLARDFYNATNELEGMSFSNRDVEVPQL